MTREEAKNLLEGKAYTIRKLLRHDMPVTAISRIQEYNAIAAKHGLDRYEVKHG